MRIWLVILVLVLSAVTATSQTVSRRYDGVSMSEALADIAKSSDYYKINFIYDELDEFPVSCHFNQLNIIDAIMAVIGHYPVKVTIREQYIFVECVEKRQTKVRGRVLGVRSAPLPNANITVFDARTGEKNSFGVSNEGGEFSIPCDSMRIHVKISHVGYKTFFKTCQAGKLGIVRLQFTNQELPSIEVTPTMQRKLSREKSSYKKKADKIREQIWNDTDSAFSQTCLDDSLCNHSSVTLAESFSGEYNRHHSWNPLRLFTNIFASGANSNHTTSRQVVRRRVMLNDSAAVERFSFLDYPQNLLSKESKNLNLVMGVRVLCPDGSINEIDTDPYTQPLQYDGEQRPDKICIPQLCQGCIIDYFTWTEQKTSGIHPPPFFIQAADSFPVLHSKINLTTDKNLSVQYRHMGDTPELFVNTDSNGNLCLSGQSRAKDTTMYYAVYVRDPQLHINRPQSAIKHQVKENPSMEDILDTTSRLYQRMRTKESYGGWASTYWNKADTTIIGLKVDNLCQTSGTRPLLEQRLYEMVMSDPPHITLKKFGASQSNSMMSLNREYTEKLAYVFERAGVPCHLAISTRTDREGILELMDEENIVWMLVTEEGRCYIPFHNEKISADMVGRMAATTDFSNIFTIQSH